jgi:hypothetical protein
VRHLLARWDDDRIGERVIRAERVGGNDTMTSHATAITAHLYVAGTWQGSSAYFVAPKPVDARTASRRSSRLIRALRRP